MQNTQEQLCPVPDGGASGEKTADAGQTADRLRSLGVPAEKLKRVKYAVSDGEGQTAPAEKQDDPQRMTWDEIMSDPEYNREMQKTVSKRVKRARAAEDGMARLAPALGLLAAKYGLAADDVDGIARAVEGDDSFYTARAEELGTSVEIARRLDRAEGELRRRDTESREAQLREHFESLRRKGEQLSHEQPSFDLRKEISDPRFVFMTQPGSPVDMELAYKALHFDELMAAAVQSAADKMSASIRSGYRPPEGGAARTASVPLEFNHKYASKQRHSEIKKRVMAGEKLYPGQLM